MGACSPLRIGIAIVILITMLLIYFFVLVITMIINGSLVNSGNMSAGEGDLIVAGVFLGGAALIGFITYKVGFDCDSKASNKPVKEAAQRI